MFACQQVHEGVGNALVDRGALYALRNRKGVSAEDILAEHIGSTVANSMRSFIRAFPFETTVKSELSRWRQQNSWCVETPATVNAHSMEQTRFQASLLEILSASRVNFFAAMSTLDASIQSDVVEKSLAKALVTLQSPDICEHGDVEAAMKELGNALSTGSPANHLVPFLVLAYARHALTTFDTALAVGLLREFRSRVGDECARSMLSSREFELLAREQSHINENLHIDPLQSQWQELSTLFNRKQQEPMQKLLSLTGLESVKRVGLSIYADFAAESQLDQARPSPTTLATTGRMLNFVFAGNPGMPTFSYRCTVTFTGTGSCRHWEDICGENICRHPTADWRASER